jgi:hypothetical protein
MTAFNAIIKNIKTMSHRFSLLFFIVPTPL